MREQSEGEGAGQTDRPACASSRAATAAREGSPRVRVGVAAHGGAIAGAALPDGRDACLLAVCVMWERNEGMYVVRGGVEVEACAARNKLKSGERNYGRKSVKYLRDKLR